MEEKLKAALIKARDVLSNYQWHPECVDAEQGWYEDYPNNDVIEILYEIDKVLGKS